MQIHEVYCSSDFFESIEMFFGSVVLYITAIAVAAGSEYFEFDENLICQTNPTFIMERVFSTPYRLNFYNEVVIDTDL